MNIKIFYLRIKRIFSYSFSYIFLEYPRGLDFSMRNKSAGISLQGSHGYALTSKKALQNILIDIPLRGKSLLDIGSGKGGVICYAVQLGCKNAAGIEYEEGLHIRALINIKKLGLDAICESYNVDAQTFDSYENFDIYFMFNPFDDDIYENVINKIVLNNKKNVSNEDKFLICYGGANISSVIKSGYFELVRESVCPERGNLIRVFKSNKI